MSGRLIPFSHSQIIYCLRVAISVALAYLLSHGSDPSGSLYAVLAAALVIGETVGEGIGVSRNRMIGTVIGVLVAVPVAMIGDISAGLVTLACVIAVLISLLVVGEIAMARIASTVALVSVLIHSGDTAHYGLYRITNTAVGIVVAVAVSYAFWPLTGRDVLSRVARVVLNDGAELLQAVAESDRADIRLRRQRSLFRSLAAFPKARKEAEQDPILRWRSSLRFETLALVVEIGLYALTLSAAVGRVDAAYRTTPWWKHCAARLNVAADNLRVAGSHFPNGWPPIEASDAHEPPLNLADVDETDREIVTDLLRHLRLLHHRLHDVQAHLQAWGRVPSRAPEAAA